MSVRHRLIRRLTVVPLIALLISCEPAPPAGDATQTPQAEAMTPGDRLLLASAKVALPPEGTQPADLPEPQSPGAAALQQYCTTCHALPDPRMHSATDWPSVLRRMWLRMGQLPPEYTVPMPEMGQRIVLLDYLTANAFEVASNLPEGPNRGLFTETCNRCHELPDPRQHSTEDWFVVVRRMNQHMQDILGTTLTSEQIERIVGYLSSAAA